MTANVYGATGKVSQSGDTMTGTLVLTGNPPLKVTTGAAAGSVLGSDASGNATWGHPSSDWINVKWYGATGNGSTDDTTAIQNAINAATTGQVVYFPAGTYIVSSTLTLASSVFYLGSDVDKTIIQMKAGANLAAVAASTGWANSTAAFSVDPLHIRYITFDGNQANQTSGAGHGVVLQTYYATVECCNFENTRGDGLRFDSTGANGSTVIGNTMVENRVVRIQCRNNGGSGFVVNDSTHTKCTDGWLRDCIVDTPGVNGIWIGAGAGWTIDGCHVYNIPQSGIRVDRAFETRIVNNYVESCGSSSTSGVYAMIDCINFAAQDNGQGSVIATNTVYFQGPPGNGGSTIAGIAFQSASGGSGNVSIVGNQIFCTGSTGLSAILLQNQNNTASLTAAVAGNNFVGWTTALQQVANGGPMTVTGDTATNLDNTNGPSDQGFIAWTYDPAATSTATPTSGSVRMSRLVLRRAATISNVWLSVVTAGVTLTANQSFVALYNASGTRLAVSADQSTSWTSAGVKQIALTASYAALPGTYYVALVTNGTTPPVFAGIGPGSNSPVNANLTVSTGRALNGPSSQTSLPTSITMASNSFNATAYWFALS